MLQGNRATGCREEGVVVEERRRHVQATPALRSLAGSWPGSDSRNRNSLHTESWLGSVTGPSSLQAVGPAKSSNLRRYPPPPPEPRLLGNFKQPEPPAALFSGLFAMARAIRVPTP